MATFKFMTPTLGREGWGYNKDMEGYKYDHNGLDIMDKYIIPVVAVQDGIVVLIDSSDHLFNPHSQVKIKHDGNFYSRYIHMRFIVCKQGDKVKKGEIIGFVGGHTTNKNDRTKSEPGGGSTEGEHLHFELHYGDDLNLYVDKGGNCKINPNFKAHTIVWEPFMPNYTVSKGKIDRLVYLLINTTTDTLNIINLDKKDTRTEIKSIPDIPLNFSLIKPLLDLKLINLNRPIKTFTFSKKDLDMSFLSSINNIYNGLPLEEDKRNQIITGNYNINTSNNNTYNYTTINVDGNKEINLANIIKNLFKDNVLHNDNKNDNTILNRLLFFLIPLFGHTFPQSDRVLFSRIARSDLLYCGFNSSDLSVLSKSLDLIDKVRVKLTSYNKIQISLKDLIKDLKLSISRDLNEGLFIYKLLNTIQMCYGSITDTMISQYKYLIEKSWQANEIAELLLYLLSYQNTMRRIDNITYSLINDASIDYFMINYSRDFIAPDKSSGLGKVNSSEYNGSNLDSIHLIGTSNETKKINGRIFSNCILENLVLDGCSLDKCRVISCILVNVSSKNSVIEGRCSIKNGEYEKTSFSGVNPEIGNNKIIYWVTISQSQLDNCKVYGCYLTTNAKVKDTYIFKTLIHNSNNVSKCYIIDSSISNSNISDCKGVTHITNCKIYDNTSLNNCEVFKSSIYSNQGIGNGKLKGTTIKNSSIENIIIDELKEVYSSDIFRCKIKSGTYRDCNIYDSLIEKDCILFNCILWTSKIVDSIKSLYGCTMNSCNVLNSALYDCIAYETSILKSISSNTLYNNSRINNKKIENKNKLSFRYDYDEDAKFYLGGLNSKRINKYQKSANQQISTPSVSSSSPSSTNFDLFSQDFKFDAPQVPKRQSQSTGGSAGSGLSGGGSRGQAKVTGLDNISKEKYFKNPDFGKMIQDFFKAQAGAESAGAVSGGESGGGSSGGSVSSSSENSSDNTKSVKEKGKQDFRNILQNMPFFNKDANSKQNVDKKQKTPNFANFIKSAPSQPTKSKDKENSANLPSFIGPPKLNFAQPQMPSAPSAGGAGGRVPDFGSSAPKPPSSQANKPVSPNSKQKPQMPPMPSLQPPTPPKSQKPVANTASPASSATSSPASSVPEDKGQKKGEDKGLAQALDGKNAEKAKAQFAPKIVDLPNNYAKNKSVSDKGEDFIGPRMPGTGAMESALPQPMTVPDFERGAMTGKPSRRSEKMAPKIINRTIKEPDVKLTIRKPPKVDDAIEFARKLGNEQFIESMRMQ